MFNMFNMFKGKPSSSEEPDQVLRKRMAADKYELLEISGNKITNKFLTSPSKVSKLSSALNDKKNTIRIIAEQYPMDTNAVELVPTDIIKLNRMYNESGLLARTVSHCCHDYGNNKNFKDNKNGHHHSDYHEHHGGVSPLSREAVFLNNEHPEWNIIMTPATFIHSKNKINTISHNHSDATKKWKGMPSLLFTTKREESFPEFLQPVYGVGDINSFQTTKLISSNDFRSKTAGKAISGIYTALKSAAAPFLKPDSTGQIDRPISLSINDLHEKLTIEENKMDIKPMRHNEYVCKLHLWDIEGIDASSKPIEATHAYFDLKAKRKNLSVGLKERGFEHPVFREFVMNQISFAQGIERTEDIDKIYDQWTQTIEAPSTLQTIQKRLSNDLSICKYNPEKEQLEKITPEQIETYTPLGSYRFLMNKVGKSQADAISDSWTSKVQNQPSSNIGRNIL